MILFIAMRLDVYIGGSEYASFIVIKLNRSVGYAFGFFSVEKISCK